MLPRALCRRPALQSEAVELCSAGRDVEGRRGRTRYIGEGTIQAGGFLQRRAEGPGNGHVAAGIGDRKDCRPNFADQIMGRNFRWRQRSVVNGDFIDPTGEFARKPTRSRTDSPTTTVYRQGAKGGGGGGNLRTISVELPVGAIIGADQVDPIGASQITTGDRVTRAVGVRTVKRTNHVIRSASIEPEEDLVAAQHRAGDSKQSTVEQCRDWRPVRDDPRRVALGCGRFDPGFQRYLPRKVQA